MVIAGHTRFKAAFKLWPDRSPVDIATDLTPEQIKAYRIADNKLAELAEWNVQLLPIEVSELKAADYDLELLGFEADQLTKIFNGDVTQGQCDPDEVAMERSPDGKWLATAGSVAQEGVPGGIVVLSNAETYGGQQMAISCMELARARR